MTVWLQISAGQGPDECCFVVAEIAKRITSEAQQLNCNMELIETVEGGRSGTFQSMLFSFTENSLPRWVEPWLGTIRWIAPSPYRPRHKRKNWYIGVHLIQPAEPLYFQLKDVRIDTCRASGPGGQHVNKTESAVRATHLPTGTIAISQDNRSQLGNRNLAIERLKRKLQIMEESAKGAAREQLHKQHANLERGNEAKAFIGMEFKPIC